MKTLLYQCPSGISGDMNLGAMAALGVDPAMLETELRKLPYSGWSLRFESDSRGGITGTRCDVVLEGKPDRHHHHHDHDGHDHHQHRSFAEIQQAIEQSGLSPRVKADAIACFQALADAEGAVHGVPPETVHFHEVGAIDSIVDIVGAAICRELLEVDRLVCNALEIGGGTVACAHGRMPVPAPATSRLLNGVPYQSGGTSHEATTPTGAAILVGCGCQFLAKTSGRQIRTGIGIGQRDVPDLPNVLYVSQIDESAEPADSQEALEADAVMELAANIDDMTGEAIGFLCEKLRGAGAYDVWQTPAYFKQDRPGSVVHVLCAMEQVEPVERVFWLHSSTLGVRRHSWQRAKLKREIRELVTPWGKVYVKVAIGPDGRVRHKFEYRDCARIATETGQSLAAIEAQLESLFAGKSD